MATDPIERLRIALTHDRAKASRLFRSQYQRLAGDQVAQFEFARDVAILGLHDAVHYVVEAYQDGIGVEPDHRKAFEWMSKAASLSDDLSFAFDLACCFRDGDGTHRDVAKFWTWMTRAADAGDPEAMFQLASAHLNSDLGDISPERAAEWTRKMADKGSPGALIQLARKYERGDGVERDLKKFLQVAQKAVRTAKAARGRRNWTYEDIPESLSALADAYRRNGKDDKALVANGEAARAANEAFEQAISFGAPASQLLPEIMLRLLPQFKGRNGKVLKRYQTDYRAWLEKIRAAVDLIYFSTGASDIPPDLVEAVFELSMLNRESRDPKTKAKSHQYLREAADAGHGEAAFMCAMAQLAKGNQLGFNEFVSVSANANNMDAMIAQQLVSSGFSGKDLHKSLDALRNLRSEVVKIRDLQHRIEPLPTGSGIAHYTDAEALFSMLSGTPNAGKNAVRLSSIVYVNDPTEGKRLRAFHATTRLNPLNWLYEGMEDVDTISWHEKEFHVFVACFSLQCDSLNLWRFYGRDGRGFSVVSPLSAFDAASTGAMFRGPWAKRERATAKLALHAVRYDDKSVEYALGKLAVALQPIQRLCKRLAPELERKLRKVGIAVIGDLLYLYKDTQYADEREVRAVE